MQPNFEENEKPESVTEKDLAEESKDKKIKNLISAAILLGGLFAGSLFVDIVQLFQGGGFSQKALREAEVIESNGRTWVAYNEPKVNVQVIGEDTCQNCDPSEALVWLRRVAPTISAEKIDVNSDRGKDLIAKFSIKTIPAFIFSDPILKTEFYNQAAVLFDQKDSSYVLKTQELGLPTGKYVELPKISDQDASFGQADAKVKVVIFSDFQCPYCKQFHATLRENMKQYGDRVFYVFKNLPLPFHKQAEPAALAAGCAGEQNKFWEYGDKLFVAQNEWSKDAGTQKFKTYARALGLDGNQFNKCLDDKKYQDKINADKSEAEAFGLTGTPAIFINDQFKGGAIDADELKQAIEQALSK